MPLLQQVPLLLALLTSGQPAAQEGAASAVQNLAAGFKQAKLAIIAAGIVPPLVALLSPDQPSTSMRAAAALDNLTVGFDQAADLITVVSALLPPLVSLLMAGQDDV